MKIISKLPNVGTTIFTEMSALANEHKAINLSQGFPNYEPDQELKDLVTFHLNNGKNQYAPMIGVQSLRLALAQKIKKCHNADIDHDLEINITAGATQAIFTSILTFVKKGDEVIVVEPAFDCYNPAIELVGGVIVSYEMESPNFNIQWEDLEKLITDKTKMIIINTPHNPTGQILKASDFKSLEKILESRDIIVLSDEVYEHLIYDGEEHTSILRYPELYKKAIAIFSFGKTFHCTGWKVGYAVMPPALMKEFRKVHQFNVFTVNSFVQYAFADYLKQPNKYLQLPEFYKKKRAILSDYIHRSRLELIPSKGSYFVLANYGKISELDDIAFTKWLTIEKSLAAIPISVFYNSKKQEKLVRFCYGKTDDVLHAAGKIILSL